MENILIVDDSNTVCSSLAVRIKLRLNINPIIVHSKQECANKLLELKGNIAVALLDLGLPDAPNGEVVEFVTKFNIPSIVLTSSQENKDNIFQNKSIIDYIIKDDGTFAYDYTVGIIDRILKNKYIKVLVVDDSKTMIAMLTNLLERYQLNVLVAHDGVEALKILKENKDISVVYTDYNMPNMDGLELIKHIRKDYTKDEMSIITITDSKDMNIVSRFLKFGSNDFLHKGFSNEEFYARLNSALETLELFTDIKDTANKDFLTGAYNRRYFFTKGTQRFEEDENIKLCMIDIDKFKLINDTYGHDIGDIAIKEVISVINRCLEDVDAIVARFGGEEFCIMLFNIQSKEFLLMLEKIRKTFESNIIKTIQGDISYTVSIGYVLNKLDSLDKMILASDEGLYKAKNSGRNQIRA